MGYYARGDNCYGRGDYYRGDYYRGDPGLFGSIGKALKSVGRVAIGAVKGFATGGPLGAVTGGARALLPSGGGLIQVPPPFAGPIAPFLPSFPPPMQIPQTTGPVGTMTPQGFLPGLCNIKGTRPNKSAYYRGVRDDQGRLTGTALLVPKGSVCVKTRRLNVANPRALRRAIRRARGFAKLARRVITFTSPRAPKGKMTFKRGRAR